MFSLNIAFLGKINSGKTSLIRLIKNEKVGVVKKKQSTISINNYSYDSDHKFNLYDTFGFKPYSDGAVELTLNSINKKISNIDAYMYVFDAEIGMDKVDMKIIEGLEKDKIIFCITKASDDEEIQENINEIKEKYGKDHKINILAYSTMFINLNNLSQSQCDIVNNERIQLNKFINDWCNDNHDKIIKIKKERLVNTKNLSLRNAIKLFKDAFESGIITEQTSIEEFINPILKKYTTKADTLSEQGSDNEESEQEEESDNDNDNEQEECSDNENDECSDEEDNAVLYNMNKKESINLDESDNEENLNNELYDDTFEGIYEYKTYLNKFNSDIYQNIIQTYFNTRCNIVNDMVCCNILDFNECFGKDRNSCQLLLQHCIETISIASTENIKSIDEIYPYEQMDFLIENSNLMMSKKTAIKCVELIEAVFIKFTKYFLNDKSNDSVRYFIKLKLLSNNINTLNYSKFALNLEIVDAPFHKKRITMKKKIVEGTETLDTPFDSLIKLFLNLDKSHQNFIDENINENSLFSY